MKTKTISLPRRILAVLLVCMMTLSCMTLSFNVIKANAATYGFDSTSSSWETDGVNWTPVTKATFSAWGNTLLIVYEKDGKLYAFGSNSSILIPVQIAMASEDGGLVRYSITNLGSNSGNISSCFYWQSGVGFEGANHMTRT